jgi:hypothetical protein
LSSLPDAAEAGQLPGAQPARAPVGRAAGLARADHQQGPRSRAGDAHRGGLGGGQDPRTPARLLRAGAGPPRYAGRRRRHRAQRRATTDLLARGCHQRRLATKAAETRETAAAPVDRLSARIAHLLDLFKTATRSGGTPSLRHPRFLARSTNYILSSPVPSGGGLALGLGSEDDFEP